MKNILSLLSENFQFLEMKSSIYLNRRVFVMNEHIFSNLNQTIMQYSVEANFTSAYDQTR